MGLNVDLCQMLGVPKKICCPKCGKTDKSGFADYDIECGSPNPKPGVWRLHCYCNKCEHEWTHEVFVRLERK